MATTQRLAEHRWKSVVRWAAKFAPEENRPPIMVLVDCKENLGTLAWDIHANEFWDAYVPKAERPPSPVPVTLPLKPVTKPRASRKKADGSSKGPDPKAKASKGAGKSSGGPGPKPTIGTGGGGPGPKPTTGSLQR
jgi:hypothetical protein